ncbi:MAG: hypothetical protein WA001_01735 [Patescibacteria group bacterium]
MPKPSTTKNIVLVSLLCLAFASLGFAVGEQRAAPSTLVGSNNQAQTQATSTAQTSPTSTSSTTSYYQNVDAWQQDQRTDAGFSIKSPIDFPVDDNFGNTPATDWRMDSNNAPGIDVLNLTIPKAFEPQTNFDEARMTIGRSANDIAVHDCLIPDVSDAPNADVSTTTINGTMFTIFHAGDAGLGNRYDLTSYRTLHDGQCYAIEFSVHSSVLENYPPEYGLMEFDETRLDNLFTLIMGTFKFD